MYTHAHDDKAHINKTSTHITLLVGRAHVQVHWEAKWWEDIPWIRETGVCVCCFPNVKSKQYTMCCKQYYHHNNITICMGKFTCMHVQYVCSHYTTNLGH
jgi:hypothetical protein